MTSFSLFSILRGRESLNPCYNGNDHDHIDGISGKTIKRVLILVITEMIMTPNGYVETRSTWF